MAPENDDPNSSPMEPSPADTNDDHFDERPDFHDEPSDDNSGGDPGRRDEGDEQHRCRDDPGTTDGRMVHT